MDAPDRSHRADGPSFTGPYRVRFDEAGADGQVRISTLARYLQDVAWQHSASAGFDRAWYTARRMGWLVRGLELRLVGGATYGETLGVSTRIAGWRRMWAHRLSEVRNAGGGLVATARVDWVLLDATGRPVRIPSDLEVLAPTVAAPFTPIRVDPGEPPSGAARVRSVVRAADVDPMGHLNNAAYLDLLTEAAVEAGQPVGGGGGTPTIRIEYLRSALPAMELVADVWATAPGLAFRLRESGGTVDLVRATVT